MKELILFLIIIITISGAPPSDVPIFNVDLDGDAFHRWDQVLASFSNDDLQNFVTLLKSSSTLQTAYDSFWSNWLETNVEFVFGTELKTEMEGVANYTNIAFKDIVEVNLVWDLNVSCSILIGYDENSNPFLSHNEDYSLGTSILRQIVMRVNFQSNGSTIFTGISYAGLVGSRAIYKSGEFSLAHDRRESNASIIEELNNLTTGAKPIFVLIRQVGENCSDFTCAFNMVNTTYIASLGYFGICGKQPNEAYVITRDREQSYLVNQTFDGTDNWYLYEGNSDLNTNPPPYDTRREIINNYMRVIRQDNWNQTGIFYVMTFYPLRRESTVWNMIAIPSSSFLQAKILSCTTIYDYANNPIDCTSCIPTCEQGICLEYQGKCSCNAGFIGDSCGTFDTTNLPTTSDNSKKVNSAFGLAISSIALTVVITVLFVIIFKSKNKKSKSKSKSKENQNQNQRDVETKSKENQKYVELNQFESNQNNLNENLIK
ncbi:n-acylethanolamine-hydrolyzing acid amidase [Anaeramoeba ignava]|uniref:N-acylethanolamine-hydrolyzing acid amidase n=1 Tax=Anaeramoeba ignava TaxID=1746090 RepID=A0A9Q0RBG0_ANAIG|nr:n-acylethanolamine-hydrolyzing acid amidase [Anaeramoeba ignava]